MGYPYMIHNYHLLSMIIVPRKLAVAGSESPVSIFWSNHSLGGRRFEQEHDKNTKIISSHSSIN